MKRSEIIKTVMLFLGAQLNAKDKRQIIDALASGAKLTKADAGRMLATLPFTELTGVGLISGMEKKELIEAITSNAKLKTVFGGKGQ